MSSNVDIYVTRFETIDNEGQTTSTSYGLRVVDDFEQTYSSHFEKSDIIGKTPAELVEIARDSDDRAASMIQFAEDELDGVHINGDFWAWDELKPQSSTPKSI